MYSLYKIFNTHHGYTHAYNLPISSLIFVSHLMRRISCFGIFLFSFHIRLCNWFYLKKDVKSSRSKFLFQEKVLKEKLKFFIFWFRNVLVEAIFWTVSNFQDNKKIFSRDYFDFSWRGKSSTPVLTKTD